MDNNERFVGDGGDFVPLDQIPAPSTITELLIAGGHACSSPEDFRPYLRGLWEWAVATDSYLDVRSGMIEGFHELGVITDEEFSNTMLLKRLNRQGRFN